MHVTLNDPHHLPRAMPILAQAKLKSSRSHAGDALTSHACCPEPWLLQRSQASATDESAAGEVAVKAGTRLCRGESVNGDTDYSLGGHQTGLPTIKCQQSFLHRRC